MCGIGCEVTKIERLEDNTLLGGHYFESAIHHERGFGREYLMHLDARTNIHVYEDNILIGRVL